jgi:hypothetical protein
MLPTGKKKNQKGNSCGGSGTRDPGSLVQVGDWISAENEKDSLANVDPTAWFSAQVPVAMGLPGGDSWATDILGPSSHFVQLFCRVSFLLLILR